MLRKLFLCMTFLFCACNPKESGKNVTTPKLGVDPSWGPLNFGPQTPYVNGFVDDLLHLIAHDRGTEFIKIQANREDLLSNLDGGLYDAVLSSVPPYTFNQAKYDFSKNFLEIGPVFIVPKKATYKKLSAMHHQYVGVIAGSSAIEILSKYPNVLIRKYLSPTDLLNGIVNGEIAGGLLARVPASAYIPDLYQEKLKIVTAPLTHQGLHLVALKGKQEDLIQAFDESLKDLKRKKIIEDLLQKWSLILK